MNDKRNIFGGYSSIPWASDGGDKIDKDCFLFTLTNIYNTEPTKFPYVQGRSIYNKSNFGPYFGLGPDLYCAHNFGNMDFSNFPYSYQDTLGKGKSIFTGNSSNENKIFSIKEVEVFELI